MRKNYSKCEEMENYRKTSHCTYDIKLWITKYRKAVLTGKIAERARELIRNVCKLDS